MIAPGIGLRILVATQPIDFRRGMDSLAVLVSEALQENPFSGSFFVFRASCKIRRPSEFPRRGDVAIATASGGGGSARLEAEQLIDG